MTAMTMGMKELCAKQLSQASGGVKSALHQYNTGDELPSPTTSEMVSTIPCGIVRHVHSAATPSGNHFGIL